MVTEAISVLEGSQVSDARRRAVLLSERIGFTAEDSGRVAIVATELATNLIKHAGGGTILAALYSDDEGDGVELIAVDRGPGMSDVNACLRDGFSTAGSAGQGLGAISRQAQFFDVASWPGQGSAVMARLARARPIIPQDEPVNTGLTLGSVATPKPGEEVCGDAWTVARDRSGRPMILVADGLGHGPAAAEASTAAVRIFSTHAAGVPNVVEAIERIHDGLRSTRGAAVAAATLDFEDGQVTFSGIGNIAGAVVGPGAIRRMVSHNGSAGVSARRVQAFDYPWPRDALVIMHSDGLSSGWSVERYPGLFAAHPSLIAAVLWRDACRGRDDATVVVARARS